MTTAFTLGLVQYATYWPPGQPDGEGGITYGAPEVLSCRWQDVATLFRDAQGEQRTSSSVVYVDRLLENGGLLAEGDYSADFVDGALDPEGLYGAALEIRGFNKSPSFDASVTLYKVFL